MSNEDRGKCVFRGCGEGFQRLSTFDLHRVGAWPERSCLTVTQMQGKGWRRDAKGNWRRAARAQP